LIDSLKNSDELFKSENLILTSAGDSYGIHKYMNWFKNIKLHVHVIFDEIQADKDKKKLLTSLKILKKEYLNNTISKDNLNKLEKYFIINDNINKNRSGHIIQNIKETKSFLAYNGWLVLVSNHVKNQQDALTIYRKKDCVEKGFTKIKSTLGLRRFYVHNSKRVVNKVFIAFVALILYSHIENVIVNHPKIFKKKSVAHFIKQITKAKAFINSDNKLYIKEITHLQRDIFDCFGIPVPTNENLNMFYKLLIEEEE
jgi:transposase